MSLNDLFRSFQCCMKSYILQFKRGSLMTFVASYSAICFLSSIIKSVSVCKTEDVCTGVCRARPY